MNSDRGELVKEVTSTEPSVDVGPLGVLPKLSSRQVRFDRRFGPLGPNLDPLVAVWNELLGGGMRVDRFSVQWRGSGLKRPGVVAQFAWPRLRTRVGLGVDPPLAHALVDRLLGFERSEAEAKLQVSPVEWGVLAFLVAKGVERLEDVPGPLGPWDLSIDRVGPDPLDIGGLGSMITWRWRVRVGHLTGSARIWFPESLFTSWLTDSEVDNDCQFNRSSSRSDSQRDWSRFDHLSSDWRAEAGTITLPANSLKGQLVLNRLLLIDDGPLSGTVASPEGKVALVQRTRTTRHSIWARVQPGSVGDRLIVTGSLEQKATLQEPLMASFANARSDQLGENPDRSAEPGSSAPSPLESTDVTVTLTVELGRVSFSLRRLAELQPGDVVTLNRHAQEPVELSSNGRLVARGELVQVDTELGVRITHLFF